MRLSSTMRCRLSYANVVKFLGSSRVVQTFGEVRAFGVSYLSTFLSLPAHLYWNFYFLSTPHNYHLDGAVG
ncbi:MAG: hypothetical protein ABI923_14115, partial [bacterium]